MAAVEKRPVWKSPNPNRGLSGLQRAAGGSVRKDVARLNGFRLEVSPHHGGTFSWIAWGEPTYNSAWDNKLYDDVESAKLAAEKYARTKEKP